jgi:sec-independent protein translocase protein TatC
MSFLEHLEELRSRILKSAAAIGLALLFCLNFSVQLIDFALRPIQKIPEITLITNETSEIYMIYFEVAFVGALCLAMPVILWQIWQFVAPGLYRHEKRLAGPFILLTTLSFIVGAIFAYRVLVPASLLFSVRLSSIVHVKQMPTISSYLSTLSWMVVVIGMVFELPAAVLVLSRIGLVSASFLLRHFKYAILLAAIVGAVATPSPDVMNMMLVTVPIVALYAVSILVAWIAGKKRTQSIELLD